MSSPAERASRAVRILVVDDEDDNRELLAVVLGWEGFVVETACGGAEALASVSKAPPDLVLLDVMMPGMNGYEVLAALKADALTRGVPVIMVSAMMQGDAAARARAAGAEDFLAKPLERASLIPRIKALLGAAAPASRGSLPL